MKRKRKISLIFFTTALIMGITTHAMGNTTGSDTSSFSWTKTLGSHSANPGGGLDFLFSADATYNFSAPDPSFSATPVIVPRGDDEFPVYPTGVALPPTVSYDADWSFGTQLFAQWDGAWGIGAFNEAFPIPNFTYNPVTITANGDLSVSGSSTVSPIQVDSGGALWNLQGNVINLLSKTGIPVVAYAAGVLDTLGVYLNAGIGLGIGAETTFHQGFDFYPYNHDDPSEVWVPVTDNTPGTHEYSVNATYRGFIFGKTEYDAYGVASISIGDSYIDWDKTWPWNLAELGSLGHQDFAFIYQGPGTVTGSYTILPTPEPTTMLLLLSGLIGLAGVRRKFSN